MYPTSTHMSQYFQKRRLEMHLTLTELARLVGYTNVLKGYRRIDTFERIGCCHPVLFAKLTAALGISEAEVKAAEHADYVDWLRAPANPPTPYLLRSPIRGCIGLPKEATTVEEMEEYAADYARQHRTPVCLVLNKRIYLRFAEDGSLRDIVEAQPPENPREKLT